jgi:hypothetical protein
MELRCMFGFFVLQNIFIGYCWCGICVQKLEYDEEYHRNCTKNSLRYWCRNKRVRTACSRQIWIWRKIVIFENKVLMPIMWNKERGKNRKTLHREELHNFYTRLTLRLCDQEEWDDTNGTCETVERTNGWKILMWELQRKGARWRYRSRLENNIILKRISGE